jgi:outer membrane receptor for ferrienterochelin and colicins
MKTNFIVLLAATLNSISLLSQNTFKAIVKDKEDKDPLPGVVVIIQGTLNGGTTNNKGFIELKNVPSGKQVVAFHYTGFEDRKDTFDFPLPTEGPIEIFLAAKAKGIEEVVISTTRSTRSIQDLPTRLEFISADEVDEKSAMTPGDVRMLLNETSGIQVQQTSATSASSSVRIQGLDGRYTQILKDGFPLYSGFSGGLGIMQIPPPDLKQVEIIKGSSSTLYGGGAIAGLINLISKTPTDKRELTFQVNGTSALGLDVSGYYSKKFRKIGLTLFGSRNSNEAYDPSGIGFSAIPKFERYTVNPRLYVYLDSSTILNFGVNASVENRIGGDMRFIHGQGDSIHSYFNRNISNRFSTQLTFDHTFRNNSRLVFKNSMNYFDRSIEVPAYYFSGNQLSSYTELTYSKRGEKLEWITGLNAYTDQFRELKDSAILKRSYSLNTFGVFAQGTWNATSWLQGEAGLREDYVINYGYYTLPRIAFLFKISPKLTSRIGGGMGYKAPSMFTETAEELQFRNVLPVNDVKAETSEGGNMDLNFRTGIVDDAVSLSINSLFFYTRLESPLILIPAGINSYQFINANGVTDTKGAELMTKLGYKRYHLFAAYMLTDAQNHFNGTTSDYPLTAKHRVNLDLMYEIEDKWKIGLESYYYGTQKLSDGTTGRNYWLCGFMVQKMWKHISVYVNFENLLNVRQTQFGDIYTGTVANPTFKEIYAPLDGFVMNTGVKLSL